jgi:2-acylglycerol O-acyltransferase 2
MKLFNIDFVPLNVPLKRRRQTFAVCIFLMIFLHVFSIIAWFNLCLLTVTPLFFVPLSYAVYYWRDFDRCEKGGYDVPFVRKLRIWTWFRDYFPVSLIKTSDLDPTRNYLFCAHPHGIMCCGIVCCFATDACSFSEKFPGLTAHCLTLKANFYAPFSREISLCCGSSVASKKGLHHILTNRENCAKSGQTCILVVGGAEEALHVQPNSYVLTIKNRKGFIKAALTTGACLVPVFSFGENDVFSTVILEKGTILKRIQDSLKVNLAKKTRFAL